MTDTSWEEFWWNNITGAHVVISKVTAALLDANMVVLQVPSDLPWRHSMRSSIHTQYKEKTDSSDIVIEPVDAADDNSGNMEPGKFILQRFAASAINRGYREKSRVAIQDYIAQKDVIKNRIIWVKGLSGNIAEQWIKFCRGFSPKAAAGGLFVLEIQGKINVSETKYLKVINYSEYVSSYDVQLFNSFVLNGQNAYSDNWKKYISTAAALVCGSDAEVSERLLHILDFRSEELTEGIGRICKNSDFSRRGSEENSDHVLWFYRNNNLTEIQHRLWAAQVQVLFPVIELERISIVKKWENNIKVALAGDIVLQYGEAIHEPMEAELGTIYYMMKHRTGTGSYLLYIPDEKVRNRIKLLHKCRNMLAHASYCIPALVAELLE